MIRKLVLTLDVGDCEPLECGGCPFRSLDYAAAVHRGAQSAGYVCTNPAMHGDECPDVSEGRTLECRAAEQEASALSALDELRECQRRVADAHQSYINDRNAGAWEQLSSAEGALLEAERATLEKLREWDR